MSSALSIQHNIPLAPYTTIQLGGPAAQFVQCDTVADIQAAVEYAKAESLPLHILGGGSNTLFADEGFAGLVAHINLKGIEFSPAGDSTLVTVAAGESWDDFVMECINRGLGGLECLSGIPGLVGATPMQNVGAYGQEVGESIEQVEVIDRMSGEIQVITKEACEFGYRTSRFKAQDAGRYIIVGVTYRLRNDGQPTIRYPQVQQAVGEEAIGAGTPALMKVREAVLKLRASKSMLVDPSDPHSRSCGSFFMNPVITQAELTALQQKYPDLPFFESEESPLSTAQAKWIGTHVKIPAAWLIEHAGFSKGDRRGEVGISAHHPLALVNYGGTTKAIVALAAEIQQTVQQAFGIELQQEPITVPYTLPAE